MDVIMADFNEILAMDDGASRKYMLTDRLGSVVAVYDETTATVSYTSYDAYGNSDAAPASPYGYAGMRVAVNNNHLSVDNLYITPNRAYSPRTGRWLQPDPLGTTPNPQTGNSYAPLTQYKDGTNIYAYVGNNPVMYRYDYGTSAGYIASGILVAAYMCAKPFYDQAMDRYPNRSDKFRHCLVSCQVAKTCGVAFAQLAGLGKELRDSMKRIGNEMEGGTGDWFDSLEDLKANQKCIHKEGYMFGRIGGWVGSIFREPCSCCCDKYY